MKPKLTLKARLSRVLTRENLDDREWQTDSTPADKNDFAWLKKAFDVTLNFSYFFLQNNGL